MEVRKKMEARRFALKLLRKLILYLVTLVLISALLAPVHIVVSNQIALGQMQNSDEAFIAMNALNTLKTIRPAIYFGVWLLFTYTVARDTYKFIKRRKTNEKTDRTDSDPGPVSDDVQRMP